MDRCDPLNRFVWHEGELVMSKGGEPPTEEEIEHAKREIHKVMQKYKSLR